MITSDYNFFIRKEDSSYVSTGDYMNTRMIKIFDRTNSDKSTSSHTPPMLFIILNSGTRSNTYYFKNRDNPIFQ